jgi:hypothetical protein
VQEDFYRNFGFYLEGDKVMYARKKGFWEDEAIDFPHMKAAALLQKQIAVNAQIAEINAQIAEINLLTETTAK